MTQPKTASKFTPGPWKAVKAVNQDTFKGYYEIYKSGHTEPIASVSPYLHPALQNARLIAQAPEMYDALEDIDQFAAYDDDTTADDLRGNLDTVRNIARRIKAEIDG